MKKLFLILLFTLLPFTIFAGPFGLKMGMTLEEVTEACGGNKPYNVKNDCYQIYPEKIHPSFTAYYAFIDKEKGLYRINAKSTGIDYSQELYRRFAETTQRLSKNYGRADKLDYSDYLPQNLYWTEGTIIDSITWKIDLKDNLKSVILYTTSYTDKRYNTQYYIILQYDFINKSAVEDAQDEVF